MPASGLIVYDVLFATRGYGWRYMVETADYMAKADLFPIDLSVGSLSGEERSLREQLLNADDIGSIEQLKTESASLSILGTSRALGKRVKIIWFNQTNTLRVISDEADLTMMTRYVETIARRTFGTETAMALAQPIA